MSTEVRVVALGGGHGTAVTLRAVRTYTSALTAIVSTADDGGSSGRLRDLLGIPALGDLRKCLGALADATSTLASVLEIRYEAGPLAGHAMGNLWLAGLLETHGDLEKAVAEAAAILGAHGHVIPATSVLTELRADASSGALVGQASIGRTATLERVSLLPATASAPTAALEAIASAEQVVIGPGSLYTSVLAASVATGIPAVLASTPARVIYVANLEAQVPETIGYTIADHVAALERHGVRVDLVLFDSAASLEVGSLAHAAVDLPLRAANGKVHDANLLAMALCSLI